MPFINLSSIVSFFKPTPSIQHFKLYFPIPPTRIQSCITKIQQLTLQNTQAIFISLNGYCTSPSIAHTLYNTFSIINQSTSIPIYTFLQQNTTSLTYYIATCGKQISANPYCVIGDVGTVAKVYVNIEKLLKFFGVKIDSLNNNGKNNRNKLYNTYQQPTQQQKQLTSKWLNIVEQQLSNNIIKNRSISPQSFPTLKSTLFTPQSALSHKLIDHIISLQQFKQQNFPQVKMNTNVFNSASNIPSLSYGQIKILSEIMQKLLLIQNDNFFMFTVEDTFKKCIEKFVMLVENRMESHEKLEELDQIIGQLMKNVQINFKSKNNFNNFII